ncbi:40S ribosomal protein S24, putative [Eimeria necatrix]|uniref:40S ribosomal protein S24, putative n=1 Tax=Eimeria necatrix TaxID=51315 RepID=U6MRK5_9EIME|nr:40S ribosomal protein S24, putative [Eimeria necatrix]CDJ65723.1 40S ribosomal protein S24, putative [Eimeria necatrix]
MSDSKAPFSVRLRKLQSNPLLQRKQLWVDVLHSGRANVSRKELQQRLAQQFKAADPRCLVLAGLRTAFGGGRSRGQALLYADFRAAQRFERRFRLRRMQAAEAEPKKGRRATKELKNRKKKVCCCCCCGGG